MSDKLEQFMKHHREEFDLGEPNAALWGKIDKQLNPNTEKRYLALIWKAAAILLIFGLSFWAQIKMEQKPQVVSQHRIIRSNPDEITDSSKKEEENTISSSPKLNTIVPEFAETEQFYNRKVNTVLKEMKVYLVKYPEVDKDMKKDIAELDSVYRSLKHDLGDNVEHEEIINAMIQNYRMKLQMLEDIKKELMQNNNSKSSSKNNSHDI